MNGCICCTTREDLHTAMMDMKKKYIDSGKIDYVIIEATGMADPEPILQTFLLNDDIAEWAKIDSCLTICDAS
jgi:G3E family GTPase